MSGNNQKLILGEVARWRSANIIDDDTRKRILDFYEEGAASRRSLGFIIFASLGALLIGLGIIALFAANWGDLSRGMRALASVAPVLVSALLCLYFKTHDKNSLAFMEPTGLFWGIAIGAGIALISQTYHLPGDMADFLLWWMLLLIPVIYATASFSAVLGYQIGVFIWTCYNQANAGVGIGYWPMIAVAIPMLVIFAKANPMGPRAILSQFGFILFSVAALGVTLEKNVAGLWTIIYSATFALCTLWGRRYEDENRGIFKTPMRTVGAFGQAVLLFILMYQWPWKEIGYYRNGARFHEWASYFDLALVILLPAAAILLTLVLGFKEKTAKAHKINAIPFWTAWTLIAPLVVIAAYAIGCGGGRGEGLSAALVAWTLALLGVGTIADGLISTSAARVNGGTLCVLAVVLGKFFSDEFSFTIKGVVFITCGILFITSNILMSKWTKRKAVAK